MRLNRLDLTRYGCFTGHSIDFGSPAAGQPDLHIIYGPNEAGKSTAFAAFLDLLFGIEPRSRFNFLHPYSAMKIGGSLQFTDGSTELVRIKKPQNSLLDANERSVSEGIILSELSGLDREAYRVMFSLDDDTLEAGGESILASEGDLGQLLFSASTGLADLSRTLIDLRAEAEGFYRPRARNIELPQLKAQLAALKEERAQIDTFANEYAHLIETRNGARVQYQEAIAERGKSQSRIDEIQRHLSAMPRLAALRAIREKLQPAAALPDAPLGWLEELPKLQAEEIALTTRSKGAEEEITQIAHELEAIIVDDASLRLASKIDGLAEQRARYLTAEKDLPERRLELREAELAMAGILNRLGRADAPDPASLILSAPVIGALRDLIEKRSGVEASLEAAQNELAEARDRLEEARAGQEEFGATSGGRKREAQVTALSEAVAALRTNDNSARKRVAERACATHRESLAERMAALRPWSGNDSQLTDLAVPHPGDMERWQETLAEANKLIDRHEDEIERLEAERRRIKAELDAISGVTGIVKEQEAVSVRAEREAAWAKHRYSLNEETATAFETALRLDDIVVNARLRQEKEIAAHRQAISKLAILEADLKSSSERLDAALASRKTVHDELADFLLTMTPRLPDSFALAQLEAWLARREKALEVRSSLKQAEQDLQEADAKIAAARETLAGALDALAVPYDPGLSFEALLTEAQSTIDRELADKALRTAMQDRAREVKARERALKKASGADENWRASWTVACSACWLGDGGANPSVAAVREILLALTDLGPAIEQKASLEDRIRKMENDQAAFAKEVAAIAQETGLDSAGGDFLELAQQISAVAQQAQIAESTKKLKAEALEAARAKQRDLSEVLAIHNKRKSEITAFFDVTSLAEAAVKLQEIAKRAELQTQAEEAERDIADALRLSSIEAAEAALDAADRAALELELAELKGRFEDQDQRTRDLFAAHSKAADRVEAVGGDDAAAKIEEKRRTLLLDIEEKALRYLRLRAGIVAAEQALHLYRDKHRSSMMARASTAFRTISRGAYRTLETLLEKDTQTLIAIMADGSSKISSDLSKGTRFQLYLALRVAGYFEFAQTRRPVPFIADDIMETFDEFRAEETFRVFAEMAKTGQVIYLTHHRHLCAIAEEICPGVHVHDLTQRQSQAPLMTTVA